MSNVLLRGLTLTYVLAACYRMSFGAGACLNPALGIAQSTYMIGYFDSQGRASERNQVIWVYIVGPFIGALLAAVFNMYHQTIADSVDAEEEYKF